MWLVWLAILFLFLLILFSPLREGITSSQLFEVQKIINNKSISADVKISQLYGDNATVTITDIPIIDILKDSASDNETKINNLQLYFVSLVNERNNNPDSIYSSIPDKISSQNFFDIVNILHNPDFDKPTDQVLQINSLGIQENSFSDIIENKTIPDEVKLFGGPDYPGPTISSLINQIIFADFTSGAPSEAPPSEAPSDEPPPENAPPSEPAPKKKRRRR